MKIVSRAAVTDSSDIGGVKLPILRLRTIGNWPHET